MASERPGSSQIQSLILVPALITLAVTLLRMVGELQHWSERLFNRQAGGAGAIVGIAWLVFIFGAYFAVKLVHSGVEGSPWATMGLAVLGFVVMLGFIVISSRVLKLSQQAQFPIITIGCIVGGAIAYRGWPALGRVLLAYGLAARVPVIIVMLLAILGNWGTHYDASGPEVAGMAPIAKWLMIGVVPQLFLWIPFTLVVGGFCGGLALFVMWLFGRSRQTATA
jgi:hypothetical protein